MTTLYAKRDLVYFYGRLLFLSCALLAFCGLACWGFTRTLAKEGYISFVIVAAFLALAFFVATIYTIYYFFKNVPPVKIDNDRITFGNSESFMLSEIETIQYTGRQRFKHFGYYSLEGMRINFKNNRGISLFDDMYSNYDKIKTSLKMALDPFQQVKAEVRPVAAINESIYFKGRFFSSFNNILLYVMILFFVWITDFALPGRKIYLVLLCPFVIFPFLFISILTKYNFELTHDKIKIRNYYMFWKTHEIDYNDILEFVIGFDLNTNWRGHDHYDYYKEF